MKSSSPQYGFRTPVPPNAYDDAQRMHTEKPFSADTQQLGSQWSRDSLAIEGASRSMSKMDSPDTTNSQRLSSHMVSTEQQGVVSPVSPDALFQAPLSARIPQHPHQDPARRERTHKAAVHDHESDIPTDASQRGSEVTDNSMHRKGVRGSLPMDVVTSMALSLGTPHRPTRVSPSFADRKPVAGSQQPVAEDRQQSFWRVCDLLFYGDDLPIAMSMLEIVQNLESAETKQEIAKTLLTVFQENDQHLRLLKASIATQLRKEVHCREVLEGNLVGKRIILTLCISSSGDFFKNLIEPTIRGLQGPYRASAGPKGALDRLLTKLSSAAPPLAVRSALKIVYSSVAKKFGDRAIETVARLYVGDLLAGTLKRIAATSRNLDAITPEGYRMLEAMAKVLRKLSMNQPFSADSELYDFNLWIESKHKTVQQIITRVLAVDEPAMTPWNSGCTAKGSVASHHTLLTFLTTHRSQINKVFTSMEWNSPTKHNARLPALWTALDGGSQGQSKAGGAFPHSTPPPSQGQVVDPRSDRVGRSAHRAPTGSNDDVQWLHTQGSVHAEATPDEALRTRYDEGGSTAGSIPVFRASSVERPRVGSASQDRKEQMSVTVKEVALTRRDLTMMPRLDHFRNLQTLDVSHNQLRDLGVVPPSLRHLHCAHNRLATLRSLAPLTQLETLNASDNNISDISEALRNNLALTHLDVSQNEIRGAVDVSLLPQLLELRLHGNSLERTEDLRLLPLNRRLARLTVFGNPLASDPDHREQLIRMLPQLQMLDGAEVLGELGQREAEELMRVNSGLTTMDLGGGDDDESLDLGGPDDALRGAARVRHGPGPFADDVLFSAADLLEEERSERVGNTRREPEPRLEPERRERSASRLAQRADEGGGLVEAGGSISRMEVRVEQRGAAAPTEAEAEQGVCEEEAAAPTWMRVVSRAESDGDRDRANGAAKRKGKAGGSAVKRRGGDEVLRSQWAQALREQHRRSLGWKDGLREGMYHPDHGNASVFTPPSARKRVVSPRPAEARGRAAGSGGRREEVEKSESSDATKVGSKKTKKKKKGLLTRVRARCKSRERERAEDRGGDSMEEEDHEREGGRDQDQEEEEEQYQGYDDRDDCDDHGVREDEQRRKQEPVKRESREEGVQVRESREEGIQVGGSGLWQKRQGLGGPGRKLCRRVVRAWVAIQRRSRRRRDVRERGQRIAMVRAVRGWEEMQQRSRKRRDWSEREQRIAMVPAGYLGSLILRLAWRWWSEAAQRSLGMRRHVRRIESRRQRRSVKDVLGAWADLRQGQGLGASRAERKRALASLRAATACLAAWIAQVHQRALARAVALRLQRKFSPGLLAEAFEKFRGGALRLARAKDRASFLRTRMDAGTVRRHWRAWSDHVRQVRWKVGRSVALLASLFERHKKRCLLLWSVASRRANALHLCGTRIEAGRRQRVFQGVLRRWVGLQIRAGSREQNAWVVQLAWGKAQRLLLRRCFEALIANRGCRVELEIIQKRIGEGAKRMTLQWAIARWEDHCEPGFAWKRVWMKVARRHYKTMQKGAYEIWKALTERRTAITDEWQRLVDHRAMAWKHLTLTWWIEWRKQRVRARAAGAIIEGKRERFLLAASLFPWKSEVDHWKILNTCEGYLTSLRQRGLRREAFGAWRWQGRREKTLRRNLPMILQHHQNRISVAFLRAWHEATFRRLHVADMLDKILDKRRQKLAHAEEDEDGLHAVLV